MNKSYERSEILFGAIEQKQSLSLITVSFYSSFIISSFLCVCVVFFFLGESINESGVESGLGGRDGHSSAA